MSDLNDTPQIITLETLQTFKDELTNNFGLKLNTTNSLIQLNNNDLFFENNTAKVINSAVFGSEHEVSEDADYPQNVLVAGFGNVVSNDNQVVFGTFNKIPSKNAILAIGNGTGKAFRNNVLEIHTDGSIVFNNNTVVSQTIPNTLSITGKLAYTENLLGDAQNVTWESLKEQVNELDDKHLVTADIIKKITSFANLTTDFDPTAYSTKLDSLVQDLNYTGDDADKKALSVAAGKALRTELLDALNAKGRYKALADDIKALRKQVSYLISCLTVDKISNESYRNADTEPLFEYYAVGIADYALDANTKFSFETTELTTDIEEN
jgi:hypothetical protein